MSSFRIFDIAGSGMSAQSVRLNTVASNLANAESVSGDAKTAYSARHPVFEAVRAQMAGMQGSETGAAVRVTRHHGRHPGAGNALPARQSAGQCRRLCLCARM